MTTELELTSSVPAPKLFKAHVLDFDTIAPKILPQAFKSIQIIEGDGGVGTIKLLTFGEGVPFTSAKQKVEAVDTENFTVKFSVIEGDVLFDIYESITYELKFVPSGGGSIVKHKSTYNCKPGAQPKEEHINYGKEQATSVFKAVEAYALAN